MTTRVQAILETFDHLSEVEKRDLTAEILRRLREWDWPPLTEEALVENAAELFAELDKAESADE